MGTLDELSDGASLPLQQAARASARAACCRFGATVGKLKAMPARLGSLPPRVAAMPKVADNFYKSAAWLAYRQQHRDWTVAQQGGVWCIVCGSTRRLILDHAAERKDGGADLPAFKDAHWYCTGCHNRKTADAKAKRARGGR